MITDFEEILKRDGVLTYPNVGTSMMPMLRQHRDLMIIHPRPEGRLKKYDAVLYKRNNKYIMHRILSVRGNDYVICGDHCVKREYGIKDSDIIGVLTAFVRDGNEISVNNKMYRVYVHLWCDFFYVRVFLIRAKWLCSGIKNRIFNKK